MTHRHSTPQPPDEDEYNRLLHLSDNLIENWKNELFTITDQITFKLVVEYTLALNTAYTFMKHCYSREEFMNHMAKTWDHVIKHIETCSCSTCAADRERRALAEATKGTKQ